MTRMKKIELDLIAKPMPHGGEQRRKDLLRNAPPRQGACCPISTNPHRVQGRSEGLVFIGGFRFAPNVDAMVYSFSGNPPAVAGKWHRTFTQPSSAATYRNFGGRLAAIRPDRGLRTGYRAALRQGPHCDRATAFWCRRQRQSQPYGTACQWAAPVRSRAMAFGCRRRHVDRRHRHKALPTRSRLHSDEALWAKLRQGG